MYKCLIHLSKLHLQPKDITNHFYQNGFEFDVYTVVVYFSSDKICCCYMIKAENAEEKEKDFHVSFIALRPFRLQCKSLGGKINIHVLMVSKQEINDFNGKLSAHKIR